MSAKSNSQLRRFCGRSLATLLVGAAAASIGGQAASGAITGFIVGSDGVPIGDALVSLSSTGSVSEDSVRTDVGGTFQFSSLSAGHYRLKATKEGFLATLYKRDSRHENGSLITVGGTGATDPRVRIVLLRAGAVAGVVRDSAGAPVPGVQLSLLRPRQTADGPFFSAPLSPATATSDERGRYRIHGVEPGRYVVAAIPLRLMGAGELQATTTVQASSGLPSGAIGGSNPAVASGSLEGKRLSYGPVYYPNTSFAEEGRILTIAQGAELADIDFVIAPVEPGLVRGSLVQTDAVELLSGSLTLTVRSLRSTAAPAMRVILDSTNRFSISDLPPGQYLLEVIGQARVNRSNPQPMWGEAVVQVVAGAASTVRLELAPFASIAGRWSVDRPADFSDARSINVQLLALNLTGAAHVPVSCQLTADRSLRCSMVRHGQYRLAADAQSRFSITAVTARGINAPSFDVSANVNDLSISLAALSSTLEGQLDLAHPMTTARYTVILFAAPDRRLAQDARLICMLDVDTAGGFRGDGLSAGNYLIYVAVGSISEHLHSTSPMMPPEAAGAEVSLAPGETQRLVLRTGGY